MSPARSVVIAWALALLLRPTPGFAVPGDLDPTFGTGGLVVTPTDTNTGAKAIALQADGKIVAVGRDNGNVAVARYLTDGTPDATFGTGGVVIGPSAEGNAVAIQPDGKIVVAGAAMGTYPDDDFAVVRYLPDGTLDPGFGSGGIVTTGFGASITSGAGGVAIQADGGIVVAGIAAGDGVISPFPLGDFALARYLPDGTLDTSFGSGGTVRTSFGGSVVGAGASSVALQVDGKIVAAGGVTAFSSPTMSFSAPALARYEADGSLDASFGSGGIVAAPSSPGIALLAIYAIALQADGDIVGAGNLGLDILDRNLKLVRYLPTGDLDATFGSSGAASLPVNVASLAIQPDGKYVAAGGTPGALAVARTLADGTLDQGFGTGGIAYVTFPPPDDVYTTANAVVIQGDGNIVAAGDLKSSQSVPVGFALTRLLIGAGGDQVCAPVGGSRSFLATPTPKLVVRGLGTAGAGGLLLGADFVLPFGHTFGSLNPITGARLVVENAAAMPLLDVTLPGDEYAGPGTRGWTLNGARTAWTYTDGTSSPIGGLIKMTIRDRSRVAARQVSVRLKGRHGTYPVGAGDLPVNVTVVLGAPSAGSSGECGQSGFSASNCQLRSSDTKLVCRG